jgi:DNA transformation protein
MFGGYGVYRDGLMVAIVVDDVLFLKADDEIFDDPVQAKRWADRAYRAVLQARPSSRASPGRRL